MRRVTPCLLLLGLIATSCETEGESGLSVDSKQQEGMCLLCGDDDDDTGGGSDVPVPIVTYLGDISPPTMKAPNRLAVTPAGDIVATDTRGRKVHVLTPRGTPRFVIEGVAKPLGVAVDGEGRIYVGDGASGSVKVFDSEGAPMGTLGQNSQEFIKPSDIAWCDANDSVYVVDSKANSVRVYSAGAFDFAFGAAGTGDGEFDFPTGIGCDSANSQLYVSDHSNSRVQVFDLSGAFLKTFGNFGGGQGEYNRPQGIALDDEGRIYVTDAYQGRLQVVDNEGAHISFLGEFGREPGQMILPLDAVLDDNNRLLVSSYKTRKIVVFGIDEYLGGGLGTVCGDGNIDSAADENCDDGNGTTEVCSYGQVSCQVCDETCKQVNGATSFCGDEITDVGNSEDCDDGNTATEVCLYGEINCQVCDETCKQITGETSFCGDGIVDIISGEDCDDENVVTEVCAYGETSCEVCDATCKMAAGATSDCGDGVVNAADGEECDDGAANSDTVGDCSTNCIATRLSAVLELKPNKLKNKHKNKTKWLKIFVEITGHGTAADIQPETARLNGVLQPKTEKRRKIRDHDKDGIPDLRMKFSTQELLDLLSEPGDHVLTLTGSLSADKVFEGSTTIKVTEKQPKKSK